MSANQAVLFVPDLHDLIALAAARRHDFDRITLLLADDGPCNGRGDGDLALLHIGLELADDLIDRLLVAVLVEEGHESTEFHRVAGKLGDIDHLRTRHLILEFGNAGLDPALLIFRGMVFGIFRKITMGACLGDRLNDSRALNRLQVLDLLKHGLMARSGHWIFDHHLKSVSSTLSGGPNPARHLSTSVVHRKPGWPAGKAATPACLP